MQKQKDVKRNKDRQYLFTAHFSNHKNDIYDDTCYKWLKASAGILHDCLYWLLEQGKYNECSEFQGLLQMMTGIIRSRKLKSEEHRYRFCVWGDEWSCERAVRILSVNRKQWICLCEYCDGQLRGECRRQWWWVVNNILLVKCESCWGKPLKYITAIKKLWAHMVLFHTQFHHYTTRPRFPLQLRKSPFRKSLDIICCGSIFVLQFSLFSFLFIDTFVKVLWCPWAAVSLETILLLVVESFFIRHPALTCEHLTEDNSSHSLLPGLIFFS